MGVKSREDLKVELHVSPSSLWVRTHIDFSDIRGQTCMSFSLITRAALLV